MTKTTAEALRSGDLSAALEAATAAVKARPTDADARWLMAEILLALRNSERADRMLDAAALQEPQPPVLEFRRLLRADVVRMQVMAEGREPRYQGEGATAAQQAALRARMLLRLGDAAAAAEAARQAEAARERAPGRWADDAGRSASFDDLRDADDLMAAEFEVLTTAGEHILLPVSRVRSIVFDAPHRLRDLIWRRCTLDMKDGTEGVVFMPALYPADATETDSAMLLGRSTDWIGDGDGPVRGRGQRMLLAGQEMLPLMSLRELVFD
jgi:type VI secretion system protein ImpE